MYRKSGTRGFPLIELLVVIAIIGMLSSIILASLNGARKKGRDARRLSDLKQMQTALELHYSDNKAYPATLLPLVPASMAAVPTDPGSSSYTYISNTTNNNYYCIGATLEGTVPAPADGCDGAVQGGGFVEPTGNYRVGP